MNIISVDPGDMSGWARIEDGKPVQIGEVEFPEEMFDWLTELSQNKPDVLVVENYRIRPAKFSKSGFAHQWGEIKAIQVIGALKYFAHLHRIGLVLQEPAVKPAAYGLAGMTYVPGKKGTHMQDAVAHGVYYYGKTQPKQSTQNT